MSEPASPREVFDRQLSAITEGRWDDLPDLYAEDTVVEQPFGVPTPARFEGREQLRKHFSGGAAMPLEMRARDVMVHHTSDPEVIIAEFTYDGRVTTTGRTFTVANIIVLRVRDGKIVSSRDYHNHLALAEATGQLPALVAALSGQDSA